MVVTKDLPGAVVPRPDMPDIVIEEIVPFVDDAQVIGNTDGNLETKRGGGKE